MPALSATPSGPNFRLSIKPVPNLPLGALSQPQPQAAYAYWLGKRGSRAMPQPKDIDPAEIPRLLPYIVLIEVLREDPVDYHYRIEGEAIRLAFGKKRQGLRLSALKDFYGPAHSGACERLASICASRAPTAHISMVTVLEHRRFELEVVLLPFSSDGERVDRIMTCTGFIPGPAELPQLHPAPYTGSIPAPQR